MWTSQNTVAKHITKVIQLIRWSVEFSTKVWFIHYLCKSAEDTPNGDNSLIWNEASAMPSASHNHHPTTHVA